ncbi:MAG: hypothetical protein QOA70_00765 [Nitrososphaeraceae archaeon]|nr:hypothetical protein [Nitrososphaeraceae archaeon]MDW0188166.1 hypothetical protein [Nitrososphaeraceae archaeon]MDW0241161.1 hypothetical protein [Nitrososphaeraceae archaeon]MDW0292416.1 hypothetical protein [Nitrososphaeraceae archaeon]
MEEKKRKKLSITEGIGGDHAASVHSGGPTLSEKDIEILPSITRTNDNWICQGCGNRFSSYEAYKLHFSSEHRS